MMYRSYTFPVTAIEKITDGDTYWLHLDVGFRQSMLAHLRLARWDTPERNRGSDFEKQQAGIATSFVAGFMQVGLLDEDLYVTTYKDPDNFGRWLADVRRGSEDLGFYLGGLQLATEWPTRWREVYDAEA